MTHSTRNTKLSVGMGRDKNKFRKWWSKRWAKSCRNRNSGSISAMSISFWKDFWSAKWKDWSTKMPKLKGLTTKSGATLTSKIAKISSRGFWIERKITALCSEAFLKKKPGCKTKSTKKNSSKQRITNLDNFPKRSPTQHINPSRSKVPNKKNSLKLNRHWKKSNLKSNW